MYDFETWPERHDTTSVKWKMIETELGVGHEDVLALVGGGYGSSSRRRPSSRRLWMLLAMMYSGMTMPPTSTWPPCATGCAAAMVLRPIRSSSRFRRA